MAAKPKTTTLTVRLSEDTRAKLDRLADLTERSKSFLVARMLEDSIDYEIDSAEKTLDALNSIEADKGIPHEDMRRELERLIEAAYTRHSRKSA